MPVHREEFIEGAEPARAAAAIPRDGTREPVVVLVIDDADDDELVAAIAAEGSDAVTGDRFAGAWSGHVDADGTVLRFQLAELEQGDALVQLEGGLQRWWYLPDPPAEVLAPLTDDHVVALLPLELAGNLGGELNIASLGGALLAAVLPSGNVAAFLGG